MNKIVVFGIVLLFLIGCASEQSRSLEVAQVKSATSNYTGKKL